MLLSLWLRMAMLKPSDRVKWGKAVATLSLVTFPQTPERRRQNQILMLEALGMIGDMRDEISQQEAGEN